MKRLLWLPLVLAACGDDTGPPDALGIDSALPFGSISLTWTIANGATPVTCGDIDADVVSLSIRPADQPFGSVDVLPCGPGEGTIELPPDTYVIDVTLGGIDIEPITFLDVVVASQQDTPLGNVAFEVEPVGGFSFQMTAAGGNCTGAGITAVELELELQAGGCVPATFDIAAGANQPAGTYQTDCNSPQPYAACIDSDQTVTAQPTITTGAYRLTIAGEVSGTPCWTKATQFDIPAAGEIRSLPIQTLIHDDITPGCNQ